MKALLLSFARILTVGSALALAAACASAPPTTTPPAAKDTGDDDSNAPKAQGSDVVSTPPPTPAPTPPPATTAITLTNISPPSVAAGSSPAGVPLTLTGTNFAAGAQISIANVLVPAIVTNATTITVTLPAANIAQPGAVVIAVVSATQQRSNDMQLAVTAPGVGGGVSGLFSVTPDFAPRAMSPQGSLLLTVAGSAFDQTSVIVFNNVDIPTLMVDTNTLRGNLPNQLLVIPGQASVSVRRQGLLTSSLPFTVGGGQQTVCQQTCDQFGMFPGQCATVGGFDFGFGPFDFGGIGGQDVQCTFDGCVVEGCH